MHLVKETQETKERKAAIPAPPEREKASGGDARREFPRSTGEISGRPKTWESTNVPPEPLGLPQSKAYYVAGGWR